MRILDLNCIAFGCFTNLRLDFSDPARTFHVVYGANEAGKSTALRALTGLFYGIPARTSDAFLHDMKNLRIAAHLERADGTRSTFVRRKGNRDTLLDVEGKSIPEKKLEEFLGGVGEDLFLTLFRLDHSSLVRGGEDLLAGKGDVAQSLFEAGTGISGLRHVLAGLDQEADSLFTSRSKSAFIKLSISEYEKHHRRMRELSVPAREWIEKQQALENDYEKLNELKGRLAKDIAKKERLTRLKLAIPYAARRNRLFKELATLGPVKELPESASEDRKRAVQRELEASNRKAEAEDKLRTLQATLEGLRTPDLFLEYEKRITALYERLDSYRNAVRDRPKILAEQEESQRQAIEILREISPTLSLAEAETLRLTVAQRTRIRSLIGEHHKLQERLKGATRRSLSTQTAWQEIRSTLEKMPDIKDTEELGRTIARIVREGDLEAAARHETGDLGLLKIQIEADLTRLPLWSGTSGQLEILKTPTMESVDLFERELNSICDTRKSIDTRRDENDRTLKAIEEEMRTLQIGWSIPMKEDLDAARSRRESGWLLIRRAWLEGKQDPDEEKEFDVDRPLDQAYERAVLDADEVADRLWREADRAAKLAALQSAKKGCTEVSAQLDDKQSKVTTELENWEQRWAETWRDSNIMPASPKEMRRWLSYHQELLSRLRGVRQNQESITQKQTRISEHKRELDTALQALGEPGISATETLVSALDRAQSILQNTNTAKKDRMDREKEVRRLAKEYEDTARELSEVKQELALWREAWRTAVLPLNLQDEIGIEEASAVVEKLDELFGQIKSTNETAVRIEAMTRYTNQFDEDVSGLRYLQPGLEDLLPEQALIKLQTLLTSAKEEAAVRRNVEKNLKEAKEVLEKCEAEIKKARDELTELMASADCKDLTDLESAEKLSDQYRTLTREFESATTILQGFSPDGDPESLVIECKEIDSDHLPFELSELEKEIASLEEERSVLDRKIGSDRSALEAIDGSDQAATEEEEAQSALASVRDYTERFMRVKIASEILRRHIERYRERNQDPILRRASEIFRNLTIGSFQSLKTGFDEKDQPVLLGVRPSLREVNVGGMSDGTRDQLFLALRLASLELQLAAAEPLPVITDDILINFDDRRAEATIKELIALSSKTQVVFFTHHLRLAELARKTVPESILKFHNLS